MSEVDFGEFQLKGARQEGGGLWEALLAGRLGKDTPLKLVDIQRLLRIYGIDEQVKPLGFDAIATQASSPTHLFIHDKDEDFFSVVKQENPLKLEVTGTRELSAEDRFKLIAAFAPDAPEIDFTLVENNPLAVLQQQVNTLELSAASNTALNEFHGAENDAERFTRFFQHMLLNLEVTADHYSTLSSRLQLSFIDAVDEDKKCFNPEMIMYQLLHLRPDANVGVLPQAELPSVLQTALNTYRPDDRSICIADKREPPVKDIDVFCFLHQMSAKMSEKRLEHIDFIASDYREVVKGIQAYVADGGRFPAKNIQIDIPPEFDWRCRASDLRSLYLALQHGGVERIRLNLPSNIEQTDAQAIKEFADFVAENANQTGVYFHNHWRSESQYIVDKAVGKQRREFFKKQILQSSAVVTPQQTVTAPLSRQRRKLPMLGEADVDINSELAQNMVVAVAEETDEQLDMQRVLAATQAAKTYGLLDAENALFKKKTSSLQTQVGMQKRLITRYEFRRLWYLLRGDMVRDQETKEYAPSAPRHFRKLQRKELMLSQAQFSKIAEPALVEILKHRDAFADGWNLEQLPAGFYIDDLETLQFSEKRQAKIKKEQHYKANIPTLSQPISILDVYDLLDKLANIAEDSPQKATARALRQQCDKHLSPYRDSVFKHVINSLPALLKLSEEEINQLFSLCESGEREFNSPLFDDFIEYRELLAALHKGDVDDIDQGSSVMFFMRHFIGSDLEREYAALKQQEEEVAEHQLKIIEGIQALELQLSGLSEDDERTAELRLDIESLEKDNRLAREKLTGLMTANKPKKDAYNEAKKVAAQKFNAFTHLANATTRSYEQVHPLLFLLESEALKSRIETLSFSEGFLDKLLVVYQSLDEEGVIRLIDIYDRQPDFSQQVIRQYYADSKSSLMKLLISKTEIDLLAGIEQRYSAIEKKWFNALLKAHLKHTSTTPIATLVASFDEFLTYIKEKNYKGLSSLPDIDGDFVHVQDMVMSLSRVQSMLARMDVHNRHSFIQNLPAIDLTGSGAHLAMLDRYSVSAVVPEMKLSPKTATFHQLFATYDVDEFVDKCRSIIDPDNQQAKEDAQEFLQADGGAQFRQAFYRYVASKPFKYDIKAFYEPLLENIEQTFDGWDAYEKLGLYILLADATTSISELPSDYSSEAARERWEAMFDSLIREETKFGMHIGKKLIAMVNKSMTLPPSTAILESLSKTLGSVLSRSALKALAIRKDVKHFASFLDKVDGYCRQFSTPVISKTPIIYQGLTLSMMPYERSDSKNNPLECFVGQMNCINKAFKRLYVREMQQFDPEVLSQAELEKEYQGICQNGDVSGNKKRLKDFIHEAAPEVIRLAGMIDTTTEGYEELTSTLASHVTALLTVTKLRKANSDSHELNATVVRALVKVMSVGLSQINRGEEGYPTARKLNAFFQKLQDEFASLVDAYNQKVERGDIVDLGSEQNDLQAKLIQKGFDTIKSELQGHYDDVALKTARDSVVGTGRLDGLLANIFDVENDKAELSAFRGFLQNVYGADLKQKEELIRFYATLRDALHERKPRQATELLMRLLKDLSTEGALTDEAGEPLPVKTVIKLVQSLDSVSKLSAFNFFCAECQVPKSVPMAERKLPNGAILKAKVFIADCRKAIEGGLTERDHLNTLFRTRLAINLLATESAEKAVAAIADDAIKFNGHETLKRLHHEIERFLATGDRERAGRNLGATLANLMRYKEELLKHQDSYQLLFREAGEPAEEVTSLFDKALQVMTERHEASEASSALAKTTGALRVSITQCLSRYVNTIDGYTADELESIKEELNQLKSNASSANLGIFEEYLQGIITAVEEKQQAVRQSEELAQYNVQVDALYSDVKDFLRQLRADIDKQGEGFGEYKAQSLGEANELITRAERLGQEALQTWLQTEIAEKLKGELTPVQPQTKFSLGFISFNVPEYFKTASYASNFAESLPSDVKKTYRTQAEELSAPSLKAVFDAMKVPQPQVIAEEAWDDSDLEALRDATTQIIDSRKTYSGVLAEAFSLLEGLCERFPDTEAQVKRLANALAQEPQGLFADEHQAEHVEAQTIHSNLSRFYSRLQTVLGAVNGCSLLGDNKTNVMRALLEHVLEDKRPGQDKSMLQRFCDFISESPYASQRPEYQAKALEVMTKYLNAGHPFDFDEYKQLINSFQQIIPNTLESNIETLWEIFEKPPCPSFEKIYAMIGQDPGETDPATIAAVDVTVKLEEYRKCPAKREEANGFDLDFARMTQAGLFENVLFDVSEDLPRLHAQTNACQEFSNDDLLEKFKEFKRKDFPLSSEDASEYLAVTAELLYRAKGRDGGPGSSFEINTTQYLALYAMLTSGRHSMSQIATGEGKTRISMLMVAMQYGLGQTVDFITSDVGLAMRDYNAYQDFFDLLGAKTSLITAGSSIAEYHEGGIHFSDPANLSLFRNKAMYDGQYDKAIASNPKKRFAMVDEADDLMLDRHNTRFNFSENASPIIKDMEWVYADLIRFFAQGGDELLETATKEDFIAWVKADTHGAFDEEERLEHASRLSKLSDDDIFKWFNAVYAAQNLIHETHYTYRESQEKRQDKDGNWYSEATLVINNKPEASAKYSFGVQQCLHARINYYLDVYTQQHPHLDNVPKGLQKIVKQLYEKGIKLFIELEKQIVVSATSGNLLDDYREGSLVAVTGTSGTALHQSEMRPRYASIFKEHEAADEQKQDMKFITVPTHHESKRDYKGYEVTKNKDAQINVLAKRIISAQDNHQPVLIICENDKESSVLIEAVKNAVEEQLTKAGRGDEIHAKLALFERISADWADEDVNAYVANEAGKPGKITIGTGRLGRGKDIKLQDGVNKEKGGGLSVLVTHIPGSRDGKQYDGRGARFGAYGSVEYVLDKSREEKRFEGYHLQLREGHYEHGHQLIPLVQQLADAQTQAERLLKLDNGNYIRHYRDYFFLTVKKMEGYDLAEAELMPRWLDFQRHSDDAWKQTLAEILEVNDGNKTKQEKEDEIETKLAAYQQSIRELWPAQITAWVEEQSQDLERREQFELAHPAITMTEEIKQALVNKNIKPEAINEFKDSDAAKQIDFSTCAIQSGKAYGRGKIKLYAPGKDVKQKSGLWSRIKAWVRGDIYFSELRTSCIDSRRQKIELPSGETVYKGNHRDSKFEKDVQEKWDEAEENYVEQETIRVLEQTLAKVEGRPQVEPGSPSTLARLGGDGQQHGVDEIPTALSQAEEHVEEQDVDPNQELGPYEYAYKDSVGEAVPHALKALIDKWQPSYVEYVKRQNLPYDTHKEVVLALATKARYYLTENFDHRSLTSDRYHGDTRLELVNGRYEVDQFEAYLKEKQGIDLSPENIDRLDFEPDRGFISQV